MLFHGKSTVQNAVIAVPLFTLSLRSLYVFFFFFSQNALVNVQDRLFYVQKRMHSRFHFFVNINEKKNEFYSWGEFTVLALAHRKRRKGENKRAGNT